MRPHTLQQYSQALARWLAPAAALLCSLCAMPSTARAQCERLNLTLTEHSCFHSRLGPFEEVRASRAGGPSSGDNLDRVHTHYRIALPTEGSVEADTASIPYTPSRSGDWAIFMEYAIPLEVRDPDGRAVDVGHVEEVFDCPFFEHVQAHTLEGGVTYELVFTLSSASSAVVVLEKVDDFIERQGRDADGDGYGDVDDTLSSACRPPSGYVDNDGDCDDGDPTIHPAAQELCDGVDRNCNGAVDDVGVPCRSGEGACAAVGVGVCEAPGEPTQCSAQALQPGLERCNGLDDDCNGVVDDGGDALCGASDAPRCVADGTGSRFCGCERDADCGGRNSGRICFRDRGEQRCMEGCVDGFERNGCLPGLRCTSQDPTTPGECVERPPASPEGDAGSDDAGSAPTDSTGGCQCRAGARTPSARDVAGWLCIALPLVVALRRRRGSQPTRHP